MYTVSAGPELVVRTARGAMLYDASYIDQPTAELFEPAAWRSRGQLEEQPGGRGTIAFIHAAERRWVLRHYRRGGLVASFLDDCYLWTGENRTRAFAEWRLLRRLVAWGLPVPRPVAARYVHGSLWYRADLMTEELPTRVTLTQTLHDRPLDDDRWADVGRCIGRLHAHGVEHADLNAHNLLLDPGGGVYVLDFDRGRVRPRGAWEQRVLARLRRSLEKVTQGLPGRFGDRQWGALLAGVASS
jgi:3-deoxy-D-manno-octulosonic acid kinase